MRLRSHVLGPSCVLLLAPCHGPFQREAVGTSGGPTVSAAWPPDAKDSGAQTEVFALTQFVVGRYTSAYDRQGMTGVVASIDQ